LDLPLKEGWKFKTGDEAKYRNSEFDDAGWAKIRVPAYWETEGYKGYDGFGWYRIRFSVPVSLAKERLVLVLGKIDDIDETYLNGERVGRTGPATEFGNFEFRSNDYLKLRAYTIPAGLLRPDAENVIAVRVFDSFLHGGIYDGPVGLVTRDRYFRWERRSEGGGNLFQRLIDFFLP
jgi:sialate O-acetylesterase